MLQMARRRNASRGADGLVDLTKADVQSLPYPDDSFDRAFAIHCIYFWRDPAACLREVRRVLRPASSQLRFVRCITGKGVNRRLTCFTYAAGMRLRSCSPIAVSGARALNPTQNVRNLVSAFSLSNE